MMGLDTVADYNQRMWMKEDYNPGQNYFKGDN